MQTPTPPASTWTPITQDPTTSGYYLLAHRGHCIRAFFFASDREWAPSAKMGWRNEDITFGPSHWMPAPKLPDYALDEDVARLFPPKRTPAQIRPERVPGLWQRLLDVVYSHRPA